MLKLSLSGLILVFDAVQSTAVLTSAKDATILATTMLVAVLSALPEISRWANAFVAGEAFSEPSPGFDTNPKD
jgi:hypothetical protein